MIDWRKMTLKELAGYVSEELRKRGIETILVGGACVTIYSNNRYQSYDLDYITYEDMKKVKKALEELGFTEKQKYFQHRDCSWFIEFVSPPVAVGNEPVCEFNTVQNSERFSNGQKAAATLACGLTENSTVKCCSLLSV